MGGDEEAKREFLRTSHPDWEPWTAYLRAVLPRAVQGARAVAVPSDYVRRSVLDELGGFDEQLPVFGNDIDFGWRLDHLAREREISREVAARILAALPRKRQNLLFSATFPNDIRTLANKMLDAPVSGGGPAAASAAPEDLTIGVSMPTRRNHSRARATVVPRLKLNAAVSGARPLAATLL